NSTDEERWQWKFGVLSAKKKKKKDTRYDVTPVNLFPYLFNTYFNTSVEYQDANSYIFNLEEDSYNFTEVTELLKKSLPGSQ
ncbi:hypothetical protein KC959_00955, partial [Candidatus Saccharibacteria bacterium]|nr:hypothetical protein [Candidatus Saccharibacteria bacterium]